MILNKKVLITLSHKSKILLSLTSTSHYFFKTLLINDVRKANFLKSNTSLYTL